MNENDLRDCFAMFGMVGLIQAYAVIGDRLDPKEICDGAYQYADAMLKARIQEPEVEEGIVAVKPKRRTK